MAEEYLTLEKGAECRIKVLGTKDRLMEYDGIFLGFTNLSGVPALMFEPLAKQKDGPKYIIIPGHVVISIEVLKEGKTNNKEHESGAHELYG